MNARVFVSCLHASRIQINKAQLQLRFLAIYTVIYARRAVLRDHALILPPFLFNKARSLPQRLRNPRWLFPKHLLKENRCAAAVTNRKPRIFPEKHREIKSRKTCVSTKTRRGGIR
jgi:hypothetical protein